MYTLLCRLCVLNVECKIEAYMFVCAFSDVNSYCTVFVSCSVCHLLTISPTEITPCLSFTADVSALAAQIQHGELLLSF